MRAPHKLFGRRVMMTTLNPVPQLFRTGPGYIVVNQAELAALARQDADVFKRLAEIARAADMREALIP